jgi:hypothetical protein
MATIYGLVTDRDGVPHAVYSADGYHTHATGVDPFRRQPSPRQVPIAARASPPRKRARRWT